MKESKEDRRAIKLITTLAMSWVLTLAFAAAFLIILLGAFVFMQREDSIVASLFIVVTIAIISFTLLWLVLRPYRKRLFVRLTRLALFMGTALLLLGCSATSVIYYVRAQNNQSGSMYCSTLSEKLATTRAATYPVATDTGTGTAFAIDSNGTLLTAYHVIEGAQRVYINFASGEVPVTIKAVAPEYDLALLTIEQPTPSHMNLTSMYSVADQAYVIGYPGNAFEAGQSSVSGGIVSRILSQDDMKLNSGVVSDALEVVQTDAAINSGNSGGPLINKCGVVGVVTSVSDRSQLHEFYGVVSEQGIGYAVSAKTAAVRFGLPILGE